MDVGYAGEDSHCWSESGVEKQDIGAVGRGDHCYRCGGLGRIANDCSTPKGKGKEDKGHGGGTGGDRRQRMIQGEGVSRESDRQMEGERHCDMQSLWQNEDMTHPGVGHSSQNTIPWSGANSSLIMTTTL